MRTLTQGRKKIHKYPWERKMTTDELMGRAINRLRFKSNVWNNSVGVPYCTVFRMVNDVRYLSGLDPMSRELFDDGIEYCKIFANDYAYALSEFRHLCWGDW
jgi:hypothetical protein